MLTAIVAANVSPGIAFFFCKKPAYRGQALCAALRAMQSDMRTYQGLCTPTGELPPSGVVQCLTMGQATALAVQIDGRMRAVAYGDDAQALDIM